MNEQMNELFVYFTLFFLVQSSEKLLWKWELVFKSNKMNINAIFTEQNHYVNQNSYPSEHKHTESDHPKKKKKSLQ